MTKSDLEASLDRALEDHIGKIFAVLVEGMIDHEPQAADRFAAALKAGMAAHASALAVLDKTVKA